MKIIKTEFDGLYVLQTINFQDNRGGFQKLFNLDHTKLVYVSKGKILDVCVDIRKSSKTYGRCFSIELNDQNAQYLYIPKGFAHGFLSLEEGSVVNYAQTSCYNKDCDCGIAQNSIDFDWPINTFCPIYRIMVMKFLL